jgi:hypothetical protein
MRSSGLTNDEDSRVAKSVVDYIFRWMGKMFLAPEQQEESGILSAEVKARLAAAHASGGNAPGVNTVEAGAVEATPGQTALFNQWDDAQPRGFRASSTPIFYSTRRELIESRR